MDRSLKKALHILKADPLDLPRKSLSFFRQRILTPMHRKMGTGIASKPSMLGCHLTFRCNLRCRQCISLEPRWQEPGAELPVSVWIEALKQAAAFNPYVYVTGGEPLVYRDIDLFLTEAKRLGLKIHLQTNGLLLARKVDLILAGGVDRVTVSLDGPRGIHDSIRGVPGAFEKSVEALKTLVQAKKKRGLRLPFIDVNCCILRSNLGVLPEMVDIAADLGVDFLQLQHVMFNTAGNLERHNRMWSEEFARRHGFDMIQPCLAESELYESEIDEIAFETELLPALAEARRRAKGEIPLGFFPDLPDNLLRPYYLDIDHHFPDYCSFSWNFLRIMPQGRVEPCFHIDMGNIAEQSLSEIWNGAAFREFRKVIDKRLPPGCARCCGRSFI